MSQNHPWSAYFGTWRIKRSQQRLDYNFGKRTLPIGTEGRRDIKNPHCHHNRLNIIMMRVKPLTICMLVTINAYEFFWLTSENDMFVNTDFLVKMSTLL